MSLLDVNFIEVNLYYRYEDANNGKRLVIIEDDEALSLMKDEEKSKNIEQLKTKWASLTWKEQNEVSKISTVIVPGSDDRRFDFVVYRDEVVKRCLKEWDMVLNRQAVPVNIENINKMPSSIILALFEKFESFIIYSETELGN